MAASFASVLEEQLLRRGVNLLRVEAGLRAKIRANLRKLGDEILRELITQDPSEPLRSAYKEARLKKLLADIDTMVNGHMSDASKELVRDLGKVAQAEAQGIVKAINGHVEFDMATISMTVADMRQLASKTLLQGAPSNEWWSRQSVKLRNKFADQIRLGMQQGETTGDLVRRIRGTAANGYADGIMEATYSETEALVRTSVQTVANAARTEVYHENDDIIGSIQWVSTLDSRTSPICMALDGLQWSLPDYEPMGHNKVYPGPTAHWGCRSTQIPVTKSWKELATQNKRIAARLDKATPSVRASMNGEAAGGLKYEDWLKKQPVAVQQDILGPTKYNLWKSGKIGFTDLTNMSNRPLSVDKLQ